MSGLLEVDCSGCGRRHVTNAEQARKERVMRCDCGHFVRLDRALADHRSEPAPPPPIDIRSASDEHEHEDDATHLLGSLAAVAAMSGRGRTRSAQPSAVDHERVSRPVQRASSLRSLSPAPARQPSIAPSDKPLWYVDLGGTDLVEMTIEQLILARRSGKLGEGALVWRQGMPSWRPVGTLIPAASASMHPAPLPTASITPDPSHPLAAPAIRTPMPGRPPAPKRTPPPSPRADEATPQSLASYERTLATLEFALEKPDVGPARVRPRSPLPSIDSSAVQVTRLRTPLPALSSPFPAPRSRPTPLPPLGSFAAPPSSPSPSHASPSTQSSSAEVSRPSPLPPPPPPPPAATYPSPVPGAPAGRGNEHPSQRALSQAQFAESWHERPRWVSVCIALLVCVSASAAGALLVRSLKQPRPSVTSTAVEAAPVVATHASTPVEVVAPTAAPTPRVVDLESLSVERKRSAPRYAPPAAKPVVQAPAASEDESADSAEPVPAEAPKSIETPPATRSNPYGSGSLIDQIKKATADEEAGQ